VDQRKFRPVQLDVITLAKVVYALVNEIGFCLQRRFQLESRRKTFARVALIAQVGKFGPQRDWKGNRMTKRDFTRLTTLASCAG
jgi:hypothetical protein